MIYLFLTNLVSFVFWLRVAYPRDLWMDSPARANVSDFSGMEVLCWLEIKSSALHISWGAGSGFPLWSLPSSLKNIIYLFQFNLLFFCLTFLTYQSVLGQLSTWNESQFCWFFCIFFCENSPRKLDGAISDSGSPFFWLQWQWRCCIARRVNLLLFRLAEVDVPASIREASLVVLRTLLSVYVSHTQFDIVFWHFLCRIK